MTIAHVIETAITRNGARPVDATTRRAEHIRELTGCSWESAVARAELERALEDRR